MIISSNPPKSFQTPKAFEVEAFSNFQFKKAEDALTYQPPEPISLVEVNRNYETTTFSGVPRNFVLINNGNNFSVSNDNPNNDNTKAQNRPRQISQLSMHILKTDGEINLDALLPGPFATNIVDEYAIKLLDKNAFKYNENKNAIVHSKYGKHEVNLLMRKRYMVPNMYGDLPRSLSLSTVEMSVNDSTSSSRSETPFTYSSSMTSLSRTSPVPSAQYNNNIMYGLPMDEIAYARTSVSNYESNSGVNMDTAGKCVTKQRKKSSLSGASSKDESLEQRKKYNCKLCTKKFTTSGHLARHKRIHTGEKNHLCPFKDCNQRFSRQDNCLQHYRTHFKNNNNNGTFSNEQQQLLMKTQLFNNNNNDKYYGDGFN